MYNQGDIKKGSLLVVIIRNPYDNDVIGSKSYGT